jgi:hypothetical protein
MVLLLQEFDESEIRGTSVFVSAFVEQVTKREIISSRSMFLKTARRGIGIGLCCGGKKPIQLGSPAFFLRPLSQIHSLHTPDISAGYKKPSPIRNKSLIIAHVTKRLFHTSRPRNAEFWKVGTNIKIFRNMLKENGSSQWKYRVVLFLVAFTILNFLFNVMLTVLTNLYLETLQPSCWQFGFSVNTEFKTGLVNEYIKLEEGTANINYFECIKSLAKDNGIIYDKNDTFDDIKKILLTIDELEGWFKGKKNLNYVSVYCDLLFRYALTCEESNYLEVNTVINRAFDIVQHFEEESGSEISTYSLKNKALRIQADLLKANDAPLSVVEAKYYDSIRLVVEKEYKRQHLENSDIAIVPADEYSSNNLTNSLLDLCSFYTETRNPKYMKKALSILLSELRALEHEFQVLDSQFNSNNIYRKETKNLSNLSERRLMELRFEKIPLVNLQISEILWFEQQYEKSIEFAKESAQVASLYAKMNFNSAKIAKLGFVNLYTMFQKLGDKEGADLCLKRSEEISIPLDAFARSAGTVRDVVLDYWFGAWGKFLFPG